MGHPHSRLLQVLYSKKVLNISSWLNKNSICTGCQLGKRCKLSFYDSKNHCQFPLEKIHCDIWGPAPIFSMLHFKYYVIFVDDCTRYTWLFPLKHKSDFYECFLKFQKLVENQFERKIKIFQSDRGGEFTSNLFTNHLAQCGIAQQLSCPNTPEQNGVAERKHQHIVETGLTMIFHATLPLKFWVDAFLTTTFLINRLPSSSLNMETPFSKLFAKNPNYNGLKVFGCKCFPYLRHHDQHKFAKKTFPCVFLGYSPIHKGHRCLDPTTNRVYLSRHVVFDESCFPYSNKYSSTNSLQLAVTTFPDQDEWLTKSKDGYTSQDPSKDNAIITPLSNDVIGCSEHITHDFSITSTPNHVDQPTANIFPTIFQDEPQSAPSIETPPIPSPPT